METDIRKSKEKFEAKEENRKRDIHERTYKANKDKQQTKLKVFI